jgi:hypothetical protein
MKSHTIQLRFCATMCNKYCVDEAKSLHFKFAFQGCQMHPFVKQQFANLKPFAIDLSNLQKGLNQCWGSGMFIPDPGSKNSNKREG